MTFIDTHCHIDLTLEKSGESFQKFFEKAASNHVEHIVHIGTSLTDSIQALACYGDHKNISISVGIHPCEINESLSLAGGEKALEEKLIQLFEQREVSAIGEVGLDFTDQSSDLERQHQMKWFSMQAQWAKTYKKPLIIHCRNAFEECFSVIQNLQCSSPVLFHCFTGNIEVAKKALDLGCILSFSGILTFKNAELIRQSAKFSPLDRILLETDAPFLAPAPLRRTINHPENLPITAQCLANIREKPLEDIANATTQLAKTIFKI